MAKSTKTETITVSMELALAKTTKNTYRFDADTTTGMPVIQSLYVHKSAFGKREPRAIKKIIVEWE